LALQKYPTIFISALRSSNISTVALIITSPVLNTMAEDRTPSGNEK